MVDKFVLAEHKGFYESLVVNNYVSSDTDENDKFVFVQLISYFLIKHKN